MRTLALQDGRELRVAGIESFALLLPEGEQAEAALQRRLQALIAGRTLRVRLIGQTTDRHGRLAALIAVQDGPFVKEALAREGLAIAFAGGESLPCFDRILTAEDEARQAGRGFWKSATLPQARPEALQARIGRFAIFEGTVISVGNRPGRTYLNFGTWWSRDVTVEIAARDRERWGGEAPLAAFAGKRLRVRGFVEDKGGPMVVVNSPMQIEALGEAVSLDGGTP